MTTTSTATLTAGLDQPTLNDVNPALSECKNNILALHSTIKTQATAAAQQYSASSPSDFQQKMEAMRQQADQSATTSINNVYAKLEKAGNDHPAAQGTILNIGKGVNGFITNVVGNLVNFLANLVTTIVKGVEAVINGIESFFSAAAQTIEAFFPL